MRVSLLRHGMTLGNDIYRGRTDVALAPHGFEQMQQATTGFSVPVDYLVSSTLVRCAKFAHQHAQPELLDERLQEMSFGDWDGRLRSDVWRDHEPQVKAFWADPLGCAAPNGETLVQVQRRAMAALSEHVQAAFSKGCKHVLIVTHGGVIRAILSELLHMKAAALFNMEVPYGGLVGLKVAQFEDVNGQPDTHISVDFSAKQDIL